MEALRPGAEARGVARQLAVPAGNRTDHWCNYHRHLGWKQVLAV
jgi:hypothetical protein